MIGYSVLSLALLQAACAGVPFQNLDFESGDTSTGVVGEGDDRAKLGLVRNWLPGWRLFGGSVEGTSGTIPLNRGLGLEVFTLYDVNYHPWDTPLEGRLGFLAGLANTENSKISLLQVGEIPAETKSLHYKAVMGPWEVRVNGISLDLNGWNATDTSSTLRDIFVDVAAWAGQEVELKFTQTLTVPWSAIDSIRFSVDPIIPEPRGSWIAGIGLLCWVATWTRGGRASASIARTAESSQ